MPELVSAIICTRNRPDSIGRAVASLLDGANAAFELIVVDQSDDSRTEEALRAFAGDARLRYQRSERRGKGIALNEGIRSAHGAIVACTDDDCIAPAGWAAAMADVLRSHSTAVIAFCNVKPVPHDPCAGYVPAFERTGERLLRSVSSMCKGIGLGAGMALRRDFVLGLGGVDESFGPGARYPSADDWDLALRALLKGKHVCETAKVSILHDGFRSFAEGRGHARRDWLAIGAMCAKPLRAGRLDALIVTLWLFFGRAIWTPIEDVLHLRRPRGLGCVVAFLRGFASGLGTRVDRKTLRFL